MNAGVLIIYIAPLCLGALALKRRDGTFRAGLKVWLEQLAKILPTMAMALVAAGFMTAMIPEAIIMRLLGGSLPVLEVLLGSVAGVLFPTGPVVVFSIAASFSASGASDASMVAFITSWTLFALHRMVIFELPMLGTSFVKVRVLSICLLPVMAGFLAVIVNRLLRWLPGLF